MRRRAFHDQGEGRYISVPKAWCGKGIAKALIARSLIAIKDVGMIEAALAVNTSNPTGAFHLYESMSYRIDSRSTLYRKHII